VSGWHQPLFAPRGPGVVASVVREVGGVPHVLMRARAAPGLRSTVELAPTAQCVPENYDPADRPPLLDYVRQSRVTTVPAATMARRPMVTGATQTARAPIEAPWRTVTPTGVQSCGPFGAPSGFPNVGQPPDGRSVPHRSVFVHFGTGGNARPPFLLGQESMCVYR
jgi:hypothetical protein